MSNILKFMAIALVAVSGLNVQAMNNEASNSDKAMEWFSRIISENGCDKILSITPRSNNDVEISSDLQIDFPGLIYVDRNDITTNGRQVIEALAACIYLQIAIGLGKPDPENDARWTASNVYAIICGNHHIKADPNA